MAVIIDNSNSNVKAAVLESGMTIMYLDKGVVIEEPMFCIPQPGQKQNELGIQFMPLLMMTDEKSCAPLNPSMILATYKPNASVCDAYEQFLVGFRAAKAGLVTARGASGLHTVK